MKIRRSLEEFDNRTIYASLDPDVLASIPDDKLEQAIVDYVMAKVGDDSDNMREIIDGQPDAFRGFFATWMLEAEVFMVDSTSISGIATGTGLKMQYQHSKTMVRTSMLK